MFNYLKTAIEVIFKKVMLCLTISMTIGLLFGHSAQNPALEGQAVSLVQQTPVSQLDSGLPDQPFGTWIKLIVGQRAGVTWQLTDCGEQVDVSSGIGGDHQACIETTALLPDDRKVVVLIWVGTFKQGIVGKPQFRFAVVERRRELFGVPHLRDLPQMFVAPVRRVSQPSTVLPTINIKSPPLPFSTAQLPLLAEAFSESMGTRNLEIDPSQRREARRISEGVLLGNVINKVVPGYPAIAKQLRLSGEVKVDITIAEDGRVIEAKAISGPPLLRPVAEEAASKWVFKPTLLNGFPVKTQGILTFVFTQP